VAGFGNSGKSRQYAAGGCGEWGPALTPLYDPNRIDPLQWLTDHVGEVVPVPATNHGADASAS
jgi:hypothetical protein